MKTALIYPYTKSDYDGCIPPISLLYLAASLKRAGEDVLVIDIDEDKLSYEGIYECLKEYAPDLVGFPVFSSVLSRAFRLHNIITAGNEDWKLVIGGPHATARPDDILKIFKGCDFVLRGESDDSLVELVKSMKNGADLSAIKGLSYRRDGEIVHNPEVDLNMDIDTIPFPARELLDSAYNKKLYWRMGHRGTTDIIISSRGCPFDCNFCFRSAKKFRMRSPENILEELKMLKARGVRNVQIMDDLFVSNKKRCMQILDLIVREGLNMEFKVRARVDTIDEELLRSLKKAGVKAIVYGIESGSQKILDAMNKRTKIEKNYAAVALTKKVGMQCYADILMGYPGETPETLKETEEFLLKAKPTAVNFSIMEPMPETNAYNEAKANGTLREDWSIEGKYPWIKLPWIEDLNTLYEHQRRIQRIYLRNPVVIFNVVRAIAFKVNFRDLKVLLRYFIRNAFSN